MNTTSKVELPPFDIQNFLDRLILVENERERWHCPHCNGKNFTINPDKGWSCWNGCTSAEIMEALRPFKQAIAQAKQNQIGSLPTTRAQPFKSRTKDAPKPANLPDTGIVLTRLSESATDVPQFIKRSDYKRGEVLVWRFDYGDRQWIERIQWADSTKEKGYDKDYFPYYLASGGEKIKIKRKNQPVEIRIAQPGETICAKGELPWQPYRLDEAIAAAKASGANAILLCEGEPCVEIYRSIGLAAITLPGVGWSKTEIESAIALLKAENLMVVGHPDHDSSGYQKADKVATACALAEVPYVQLDPIEIEAEIQEHGDVANLVTKLGEEEYVRRLEAEIHRQVELRQQIDGGESVPPSGGGSGGGKSRRGGNSNASPDDRNPDHPFRDICDDFNLPFEHCCTRQQFDGSAYRVLFGGAAGDWTVINSAFYRWTGTHWECKTDSRIHKLISDYGEQAFKLNFDRDGEPYITRPYENNKHKESAFKYCRSRLERDILTTNVHLLGFNDCVVDLRTGQTMPHDKEFLLTNIIPHNYEPNSACPEVFRQFIIESFGEEMLEPIRAFTAAFLDPTAPYGRFPHLLGQSGGGKGTLGRLWSSLFGVDGAGSASNFSDLSTPEGRHQFLTGKRIFAFPDVGGYSQGLRAFYELVDNGSMTGRALFSPVAYSKVWSIRFWVASVDHLQVENAGDGWARRAYLIPVRERKVDPDPDLSIKLEAVKAQIIAWALSMPKAERDAILLLPPKSDRVKSLTLDAALYGDSTRSFVDLCLRPIADSTATVSHSQLHTWYTAYCREHGYTPLGQTKFISHLRTVLPRNYVDRAWSPMIQGQRTRVPAHWTAIAPMLEIFISANTGTAEVPQNPEWTCIKARCTEGGLEEFDAFWNSPSETKTLEPLSSGGVHPVQHENREDFSLDSLKPLHSAGVQGGSTVQTKSFDTVAQTVNPLVQQQVKTTALEVNLPSGQVGQAGQADQEPIPANSSDLDNTDKVDSPKLLDAAQLDRVVQRMATIHSIESFSEFYDLFSRCTKPQRDQILDRFTTDVDQDQQGCVYEFWHQVESLEEIESELSQESVQAPDSQAKWVYVQLPGDSCETLVRVLSQKSGSLSVRVPGAGVKSIKLSNVIRTSDYMGD